MRLSIIIPIYNGEKYIARTIESIINQSFGDFELILVDDGSNDRSSEICKQFQKKDNRIVFISQANSGVSCARNRGLDIAKGEWIMFVDSDDLVKENFLEEINTYLCTLCDVIIFQHAFNGDEDIHKLDLSEDKDYRGQELLLSLYKQDKLFITVWKYLYRRKFLIDNAFRFIEGIIHEDEVWTVSVLLNTDKVCFCNKVGYDYIIRMNSITTSSPSFNKYISYIRAGIELDRLIMSNHIKSIQLKNILKRQSAHFFLGGSLGLCSCTDNLEFVKNNIYMIKNIRGLKQIIKLIKLFICMIIK